MRLPFLILAISISAICSAQNWETDFKTAQKQAAENNLPIILVFQGSDWCAPCMKLDKEVWSTDVFQEYSKSHYVMLKADFPRRKANRLDESQQKHNNQLAEKYNQKGYFPHVVVLDAKGEVLGRTGYEKKSPDEYITLINSFLE